MGQYTRAVVIDAPLDVVWAFHSTTTGLHELTPSWLGLTVDVLCDADTDPAQPELTPGTELALSIRPFGLISLGPWIARITSRDYSSETASFTDELIDGPVRRMVHTHQFVAVDGQTRMCDRVEYECPYEPLHRLSGLARPILAGVFRYRHRRIKSLLEDTPAKP